MDDVAIFVTNLYYLVIAVRHSCTTAFPLIVSWHGLVCSNKSMKYNASWSFKVLWSVGQSSFA